PNISRHELPTTMHHLSLCPRRELDISIDSRGCQDLVRFFALLRIKPHAPALVRAPVHSFEFQACGRTLQADCLLRSLHPQRAETPSHLALIVYGVDYQGI